MSKKQPVVVEEVVVDVANQRRRSMAIHLSLIRILLKKFAKPSRKLTFPLRLQPRKTHPKRRLSPRSVSGGEGRRKRTSSYQF